MDLPFTSSLSVLPSSVGGSVWAQCGWVGALPSRQGSAAGFGVWLGGQPCPDLCNGTVSCRDMGSRTATGETTMLTRKGGSRSKGTSLLIAMREGPNSGSFIFWPQFRTVLRSVNNLKYWLQWEYSCSAGCARVKYLWSWALAGVVKVAEVFFILCLLHPWHLQLLTTC